MWHSRPAGIQNPLLLPPVVYGHAAARKHSFPPHFEGGAVDSNWIPPAGPASGHARGSCLGPLAQKGARIGLMLCCRGLEILNKFSCEFVFYKWRPME